MALQRRKIRGQQGCRRSQGGATPRGDSGAQGGRGRAPPLLADEQVFLDAVLEEERAVDAETLEEAGDLRRG